jgi:ferrous iron transport protein B
MTVRTLSVALVGNPNTGKTTLFNALTGLNQRVGNYPGVTVEMKKGTTTHGEATLQVLDLPGTYSLAPRSPDEMVAVEVLLGQRPEEPRPDVIVSVVDASNLDRHLYLTTQVLELGRPVVLALNMIDVARAQGLTIDVAELATQLGVPVVSVQANTGQGVPDLKSALVQAASQAPPTAPAFPEAFEHEVQGLVSALPALEPFVVRRAVLDIGGSAEARVLAQAGAPSAAQMVALRQRLADAGCPIPAIEAKTRYAWIRGKTRPCVQAPTQRAVSWSDRIDQVLTHRVWGTLIFLTVMLAVFLALFAGAKPLMGGITAGQEWLADLVEQNLSPGPFTSLLTDGLIKGVGSVLVFLPQILILFGFIAILEDCGYMARAAFLMDRLMARAGLNGKSFIPLLSSVACAVPGILATRVIENPRDRLATILVAPLMSCSARLPVYTLLIGTFFSEPWWLPGVVLFGLYLLGFVVAPLVAWALKATLLRGPTPLFVLEMPAYRWPTVDGVARRMYDAGAAFVARAGTLILASMVLIWALLYFPVPADVAGQNYPVLVAEAKKKAEKLAEEAKEDEELQDAAESAEVHVKELVGTWQRDSYLGQAGRALEPVFTPLGWDWKVGMAALASFPAREVIVGTLGIIYNQGQVSSDDLALEKSSDLGQAIAADWESDPTRAKYRTPAALSLLVFFALCAQCASTLAVIRRETKSWFWPTFTFVYMTGLAYIGAFVVFQVGRWWIG